MNPKWDLIKPVMYLKSRFNFYNYIDMRHNVFIRLMSGIILTV
ncbi:hypothetical protein DFN07_002728 [Clostridium beijerinckii]|nr:hypothetical protein [Clostridium beijerinckii]